MLTLTALGKKPDLDKIRRLMCLRGDTIASLAREAHVSAALLRHIFYEKGYEVSPPSLKKIAQVLTGGDARDLLCDL